MSDLMIETEATAGAVAYDFLRPPRISRDRHTILHTIYTRFALSMQALLTSRLRLPADATIKSVEQATFAEYITSLGDPCAAFVFDLGGTSGQGVLDLGTDLAFQLIDRMFGGPGIRVRALARALTPLERLVVKGIADRALAFLGEVWSEHADFKPSQVGYEATPDALQIANREDNVLVTTLEVRAADFAGLMTVCIPLAALEAFLQEKRGHAIRDARTNPVERAAARVQVERTLRVATMPIIARLPLFSLRARDVAALAVGQVIHTGFPVEVPLEVHVAGKRRFLGVPGRTKRTMGVRIIQTCPAGQAEPTGRNSRARVL
jgi:flagellar motor switch protein FliM